MQAGYALLLNQAINTINAMKIRNPIPPLCLSRKSHSVIRSLSHIPTARHCSAERREFSGADAEEGQDIDAAGPRHPGRGRHSPFGKLRISRAR
jgi:hypothetical protein